MRKRSNPGKEDEQGKGPEVEVILEHLRKKKSCSLFLTGHRGREKPLIGKQGQSCQDQPQLPGLRAHDRPDRFSEVVLTDHKAQEGLSWASWA